MLANPVPWPDGARCAVSITWDMDVDSSLNFYQKERADTLLAAQSLTRYDAFVAVPRLARLFGDMKLPQTFFVPGWCIEKYPDPCRIILEHGHELALHGYLHERPNELSADEERYWLDRAVTAYERFAEAHATGWRAPSFAFSKYSLPYLAEHGFRYDSSLMGDDVPYLIEDGRGASLLELPTDWTNDDWPQFMHNRDFSYTMPISEPDKGMAVFRAQFEAAWNIGGLFITVWHPFLSGRPARLEAVLRLVEFMQEKGGVWFARLDQIQAHVGRLMAAGKWTPRKDVVPPYRTPLPEFAEAPHAPVR